ncbi:MAG: hypothetical protein HY347_01230 [candidate division NC10 bacterium]|nr:hypothetical protein [candidate division NC10 bacterium]
MRRGVPVLFVFTVVGFLLLLSTQAFAVPAFARAYGVACNACHTAWPALNATGRSFKENGYMMERGEPKEQMKLADKLTLPKIFPLALVVKLRPFDEKKDGPKKLRSLHELEIFFAGNVFRYGSFFGELELEDENDFEVETALGVVGFHPHPLFSIVMGKGAVFHADPYDSLSNARRLTRSSRAPMAQGFSTKVPLQDEHQMVGFYGRETLLNRLFYSLTYSADVADNEGEGPKDLSGRLAFNILPDLMIGAFVSTGSQDTTSGGVTKELDFDRVGIDAQARFGGLNLLGTFLWATDDLFTGGDERNNAWYLEAFYTIEEDKLKGIPLFMVVPLVRVDGYQKNDGKDDFLDLTLNLGFYPWQNVKLFVEYFTSLDRPNGVTNDWRWTVEAAVAF